MKRVLIVKEGQWGSVKPEEYEEQIELYQRILDEAKDYKGEKAAKVEVVATAEKAEKIIKTAPLNDKIDVVIFISRGMEWIAEKFAATYPRTRVIVFTGLIPEGKVIWLQKSATIGGETIRDIVLHSG